MSHCGIVILAAGSSSRLGRSKQTLQLGGVSLLRRAAQTAFATPYRPIFVVLGAGAAEAAKELAGLSVRIVVNPDWEKGMGASIRVGVAAVAASAPRPQAVAVMLCDQPLITAKMIDELVNRRDATGKKICAASYGGTLGTPAVFGAQLFDELINLPDDAGGKAIIARHAADVEAIDLPQAQTDIDTESDVERIRISFPDSTR